MAIATATSMRIIQSWNEPFAAHTKFKNAAKQRANYGTDVAARIDTQAEAPQWRTSTSLPEGIHAVCLKSQKKNH
jgi:hypothetical protein